jgi:hypothetical protein
MTAGDEIDALYALPLDEFTSARNELARSLRNDGRRDEAETVAGLRKPTLPAWVVNQLARERRAEVEQLLGAAAAIKAGAGDGDARFRASVDALLRSARQILADAGRKPTDSVLQEVATTLRASAASAPEELAAGRLSEALETTGFDVLAGSAPRSRAKAATPKRAEPKVDRAALDAARKALTQARDEVRELRRHAVAAEREAQRAQGTLADAETRVAEAERRVEELRAPR